MPIQVHPMEQPLPDGDPDIVIMQIGSRGHMARDKLSEVVAAFHEVLRVYPGTEIAFTCEGFDEDPRPVWEIPEAAARFRGLAALLFPDGYDPIIHRLEQSTIAVLAECGSWPDGHPFLVSIVPDKPA